MNAYKKIDLGLQAILTLMAAIGGIFLCGEWWFGWFYFPVGGLQLISVFVHRSLETRYCRHYLRRIYEMILAWFVPVCIVTAPLYFMGALLALFLSPVMAVFYMYICFREIETLNKKQLIHLK